MFCKNKFTILLFSLSIGKQGIPIWFRCFKGKHNADAYKMDLIKEGISYCKNLFDGKNCIESIFKSQKSNGFRLESTNTQKIEHFISLFTVMCIALVWLTIIGSDYVKNKNKYHLKIRDVRKHKNGSTTRLYSLFNIGLSIFNLCYYNYIDFKLKFNFLLYDI